MSIVANNPPLRDVSAPAELRVASNGRVLVEQYLITETLGDVLSYDRETGIFTWLKTKRAMRAGPAGWLDTCGYLCIRIQKTKIRLHRLAWFFETGCWPSKEIDHINGVKTDNRFANLREATRSQNVCNKGPRSDSKSGVKGVRWCSKYKYWVVYICIDKKRKYLGSFVEINDAAKCYEEAARKHHKEFART